MSDMEQDIFAETPFGKIALKKMQPVSENFRLYEVGWMEERPEDFETMMVRGAEFRRAKSGPRKGKLAIKLKGTEKTVYLKKEQIR